MGPCRTRRAVDDGLHLGYPPPTDPSDPLPDAHEAFALSVLSLHDILPAAGGHPACCRACLVPPDACPVWALADGFLGITWSNPAGEPAPDPVGPPPPPAGIR
jgi:hypothetical protein